MEYFKHGLMGNSVGRAKGQNVDENVNNIKHPQRVLGGMCDSHIGVVLRLRRHFGLRLLSSTGSVLM